LRRYVDLYLELYRKKGRGDVGGRLHRSPTPLPQIFEKIWGFTEKRKGR
jgi:hypothetical protein